MDKDIIGMPVHGKVPPNLIWSSQVEIGTTYGMDLQAIRLQLGGNGGANITPAPED